MTFTKHVYEAAQKHGAGHRMKFGIKAVRRFCPYASSFTAGAKFGFVLAINLLRTGAFIRACETTSPDPADWLKEQMEAM